MVADDSQNLRSGPLRCVHEFPQPRYSDFGCRIAISGTHRSPCQTGPELLSSLHILSKFASYNAKVSTYFDTCWFNSQTVSLASLFVLYILPGLLFFTDSLSRINQRSSEVTLRYFLHHFQFFRLFHSYLIRHQRPRSLQRARPNLVLLYPRSARSSNWSGTRVDTCANFPSGGLPAFQGANM